jgi:flagellar biosynthetic protein FliS
MIGAETNSQAHKDYHESRILSAHPVEIVQMLYQIAIDNLNIAIACLKTGDNFERSQAVTKAQKAVYELMFGLDPAVPAPTTRTLAELYDYVQREIIAGHTGRSEQAFADALAVLNILAKGWSGVKANVLGKQETEPELPTAPETRSETTPENEISHLYAEPPREDSAQDWSC